ncbi:hypothetical protein BGX23_011925 [Mortierella sp. AD031]|nr:hypothetical protein BGX23_011925 [Mortierella sp. AD031]
MGFRQSVVAPLDTHSNRAGVGTSEQQKQEYTHMNQQAEQSYSAHEMQEPERVWMSGERRSSQDSNIIVFPKDKKILQEVLTFRDDITKESDGGLPILTKPVSAGTNEGVLEARTVFITNHYGLGDMLFDKPGESLSDMIFKAAQPLSLDLTSKEVFKTRHTKEFARRGSHDSEQTDSDTRAESPTFSPKSPTLSATTTLDGFGVLEQQEGGKESAGANLSLTLAGDIGELVDDPYSQPSQIAYEDWISRHQGPICAAVPLKHPSQFPTVPERRSSFNHTTQWTHYSPSSGDEGDLDQYEYHTHFVSPAMQPNSPDAHPYSGDYFSSSNTHSPSDHVQSTTQPTPSSRPKPNLASLPLQYWRNRNNGNSNHVEDASSSSPSNTSSVPFSLVNSFSKKKRQPPTLPTAELVPQLPQPPPPPPLPTLMIPTIVLHPDEEDGEPVRVLSEMDIEYLSTMPPAPLRPLIPSWEEGEEDEYYDQDINEGYDYDYYHQGYEQEYEEGEEGEGDEIMAEEDIGYMDAGMDVDEEDGVQAANGGGGVVRIVGRLEQPGINSEVEYDPYALDVPIHLEIDLQGLEQGDITGFGSRSQGKSIPSQVSPTPESDPAADPAIVPDATISISIPISEPMAISNSISTYNSMTTSDPAATNADSIASADPVANTDVIATTDPL